MSFLTEAVTFTGQPTPESLLVTLRTIMFSIQELHILPTQCIYVFCTDIRTKNDYFPIKHELTDFHNRDGKCLRHEVNVKYNSGSF